SGYLAGWNTAKDSLYGFFLKFITVLVQSYHLMNVFYHSFRVSCKVGMGHYAYEALKKELADIEELRFIFTTSESRAYYSAVRTY
ncbi:MAG: hypothetical protein J6O04_01885, partial [Selenomonadaceae bacterium]|nr:hypothetical protein [Selenomonadaceae bacterium]